MMMLRSCLHLVMITGGDSVLSPASLSMYPHTEVDLLSPIVRSTNIAESKAVMLSTAWLSLSLC